MNLFGKILAIVLVIAAPLAAYFTSKVIVVRNSYTAKVLAYKTKYSKELLPKIEELEAKVEVRKNELIRSKELWGKAFEGVQTTVQNPNDGSLNIGIGLESEVHPNLVLYGFETAEDGTSVYRGSFITIESANGSAILKPNWRVKSDEIKTWKSPGVWRWRTAVPTAHHEYFDRQLLTILKHEETLGDRRRTVEAQKLLLEQANETLKKREAELVGGDQLVKAASVDAEFREGLIPATEQLEESRNKILQQVDELRHKVRIAQREIELLNKENQGLIRRLPASTSDKNLTQMQK